MKNINDDYDSDFEVIGKETSPNPPNQSTQTVQGKSTQTIDLDNLSQEVIRTLEPNNSLTQYLVSATGDLANIALDATVELCKMMSLCIARCVNIFRQTVTTILNLGTEATLELSYAFTKSLIEGAKEIISTAANKALGYTTEQNTHSQHDNKLNTQSFILRLSEKLINPFEKAFMQIAKAAEDEKDHMMNTLSRYRDNINNSCDTFVKDFEKNKVSFVQNITGIKAKFTEKFSAQSNTGQSYQR